MKTMRRDQVIDKLTESRIDTCMIDPFYLYEAIKNYGLKAFCDYTNKELEIEYNFEFDEEVKIKL
jgi:hypothetical protein